jgi:hypothetical protein
MRLVRNPLPMLLFVGGLVALLVLLAVKVTWTPVAPLRLARRRRWGQILSASGRMYVHRPLLFVAIGVLLIPVTFVITALQWLLYRATDLLATMTGQGAGTFAYLALVIGTTLAFVGFGLVQAATTCALVEIDAGRPVDAVHAYRLAARRLRPLLGGLAVLVAVAVTLSTTMVLLPVAAWLVVRWSLLAQVVELEGLAARPALRRSAQLVRGRWLRVASLVGLGGALALAAGPLAGALLIFVSNSSLALLNLLAGVVYAIALPFVALVTSYVYFDTRVREELEPREERAELPAEIELAT